MKEEIVVSNLGNRDISRLVEKLSGISFRVVNFGKNSRYILPAEEKSPEIIPGKVYFENFNPRIIGGYDPSPLNTIFDSLFAQQNYIGFIRKSSAGIITYGENDDRSKNDRLQHATAVLRKIMLS